MSKQKKRIHEILYIVLVVFTLFTGLSLFSYNKSDPSYSNIVFNRYDDSVHNIFGKSGAYIADLLGTVLGWVALLVPFFILFFLVHLIRLYRDRETSVEVFLSTVSMILLLISLAIFSGFTPNIDIFFTDKPSGGLFGVAGATVISSIVGILGGKILSIVIIGVAVLGTLRMSLIEFVSKIVRLLSAFASIFKRRPRYNAEDDTYTDNAYVTQVPIVERDYSNPKVVMHNHSLQEVRAGLLSRVTGGITKPFRGIVAFLTKSKESRKQKAARKQSDRQEEAIDFARSHEETFRRQKETVYKQEEVRKHLREQMNKDRYAELLDIVPEERNELQNLYNYIYDTIGGEDGNHKAKPKSIGDEDKTLQKPSEKSQKINTAINKNDEELLNPYGDKVSDGSLEAVISDMAMLESGEGSPRHLSNEVLGDDLGDDLEGGSEYVYRSPRSSKNINGVTNASEDSLARELTQGSIEDYLISLLPEGEQLLTVSRMEQLIAEQESKNNSSRGDSGQGRTSGSLATDANMSNEGSEAPIVKDFVKYLPNAKDVQSVVVGKGYHVPFDLLDPPSDDIEEQDPEELQAKADLLLRTLRDFNVEGKINEIRPGPVVTLFEFEPAPGVKVNRIANLENDLALAMSAISIRIIAPIPGRGAVGIEIPNEKRMMVGLRELLESKEFKQNTSPLAIALGKDIAGNPYFSDLRKMPHLLIAGTTGSGKSVCVNTIICSILYKAAPDRVKFVMVDPKMVELSVYEGIPHLAAPVVTDPRKASTVLQNVVKEMEGRYVKLAFCRTRSIDSYNEYVEKHPGECDDDGNPLELMPYMVVIVDEFADLMLVAGKEVENSIIRIAQMARAVGMHLILATQRPSVNVITGIIKANMPARLSFRVSSKIDSRTVIDQNGAEILLGKGDSLFIPPGCSEPVRIHGAFVGEAEVLRLVDDLQRYGKPDYDMTLLEEKSILDIMDDEEEDAKYSEAVELVRERGSASISMVQRYLRIGYNRAARIVEMMEARGLIASSDGTSRPRDYIGDD